MELKLTKTLLSKRPERSSFLAGLIGLSVLALFFGADEKMFWASGKEVFQDHEYWRLFTATLLHADLNHLVHNAFFFMGLAALLFNYFGLWVYPVLTFLAGGLINLVTISFYEPDVHIVGVSGVIYFMASFWLTLYLLIEKRQKFKTRLLHAAAVSLIFLFPETYEGKVSYLCHGVGFVLGAASGVLYYLSFKKKIRSQDVWTEIVKDNSEEMDNAILLDASSYHLVTPEELAPSPPSSDSSQCRSH